MQDIKKVGTKMKKLALPPKIEDMPKIKKNRPTESHIGEDITTDLKKLYLFSLSIFLKYRPARK